MPAPYQVLAVLWIPDTGESASITPTETKYTGVFRVFYYAPGDVPSVTSLGTCYDAIGATDGTNTVPGMGRQLVINGVATGTFVNGIRTQRGSEPNYIDVYVSASSNSTQQGQTGKWNIDIATDFQAYTENVTRWNDNTLIVNSAHDLYENGVPRTGYDEKITVSFNSDQVTGDAVAAAVGKINTDAITMTVKGQTRTFAAYSLKLMGAPYKTTFQSATSTYTAFSCSIVLLHRIDTWVTKLVDRGRRILGSDGKPYPVTDKSLLVNGLVYLDGTGKRLDTSGGSTTAKFFPDPTSAPHYVDFATAFTPILSGIV